MSGQVVFCSRLPFQSSLGILFRHGQPALQLLRAERGADDAERPPRIFRRRARAAEIRSALIVAEVALTIILLTGASVSIRGAFWRSNISRSAISPKMCSP